MPNSTVEIHTELLDKITENIDVDGIYLKAGVMERGVDQESGSEVDPRTYAYKHEMGIGVPQRSFLRSTMNERRDEWVTEFKAHLLKRNYDVRTALNDMVGNVVGRIQEKFYENNWTPLSPFTIESKKKAGYPFPDKPLIATSTLKSSISAEVVDK